MAEQVVAARLPWWKRIFRRKHTAEAGQPRAGETGRGEPSGSATKRGTDRQGTWWGFIVGRGRASTTSFSSDPEASNSSLTRRRDPVTPVRMPAPPSARTHRLRGKLLTALLLVVVVFALVPSLRHQVSKGYTQVEGVFVPTYSKVPLASAKTTGPGGLWRCRIAGQ